MPPQNAREHSDLTRQIKNILDGYPYGVEILRELLQNSDDASATTQSFILDCRQHDTESLVHPSFAEHQGPALLAVNDTVFKVPDDWEALRKIHGSNKTSDESKTGKYGLGFRANYHLTDNPHVLSGDRLYIADPHERFPDPLNGGAYLFMDDVDNAQYSSHFKAFQAAGVTSDMAYVDQTVVRLPLRNSYQAEKSEICNRETTIEHIKALFRSFIANELDIILLFLKNVKSIELSEIGHDGSKVVIASASLTQSSTPAPTAAATHASTTFLADYRTTSLGERDRNATWRFYHRTYSRLHAIQTLSSRLDRAPVELERDLRMDKLVAEVNLAYRLDPNPIASGRLFTLLPLPQSISPQIPIHLHSNFALTSDRQHLKNFEHVDDPESKQHRNGLLAHWNKAIFEYFVPPAWAGLLEIVGQDLKRRKLEDIWMVFPLQVSSNSGSYWETLLDSILDEVILNDLAVFPTLNIELSPLKDSYIINPKDSICPTATLAKLGISLTKPPAAICERLGSKASILTPCVLSQLLRDCIDRLQACDDDEKDAILMYLLPGDGSDESNDDAALGLPIIPLISGERVLLNRQPLTPLHITQGLSHCAVDAWAKLGIPFLHPRVPESKVKDFGVSLKDDVSFFVRHAKPSNISNLLPDDWNEIRRSLASLQQNLTLSQDCTITFKQLPIFPVRENLPDAGRPDESKVSITYQGPVIGVHFFVEPYPLCPLPFLPQTTFVDVQIEPSLSRLLGGPPRIMKEPDILGMALDHWDEQPLYLRWRLLPRILSRLADLPSPCVERVRNLPFIPIGNRVVPPCDAIDPESPIAGLYTDDELPSGMFGFGSKMLDQLRRHDLIRQTLTPELLNDRIHWISDHAPASLPTAIHLIEVMDAAWDSKFVTEVDGCQSLAWIPTIIETLASPSSCFFNDYTNYTERSGGFGQEVTALLSPLLAQRLGIPFLSALLAGEDNEGEGEEAMSVELLSRIQAVLHDYDINYAINEFLANANDAGATEFSMMLDHGTYSEDQGELPISPALSQLLSQPALIIHNDAKFAETDFQGILQIDKGGKLDNPDVIGRYGLGALSLFYFTDVVTIISGEHVLIMDPSGEHLPRTIKGRKRTALRRTLASIHRNSPSHLRPFEGKYDCNYTQGGFYYDGTMFRLPLYHGSSLSKARKPINTQTCREILLQYEDLARTAFFFTNLEDIDARVRDVEGEISCLWELRAERKMHSDDGEIRVQQLTLPRKEAWFIAQRQVQIPEKFQDVRPYRLKVQGPISISIALPTKLSAKESYLFSHLQLPSPISIPCHLSAPFALPSSRRGIHFDPTRDSNRKQSINDTEWNRWILSMEFPRFYLATLSLLKDIRSISLLDYFPTNDFTKNNITQEFYNSFYPHLLNSDLPVFPAITGAPKSCNNAIFLSVLPDGIKRKDIETILKLLALPDVVLLSPQLLDRLPLVPYAAASAHTRPQVMSPAMFREELGFHSLKFEELYKNGDIDLEQVTTVLRLLLSDGGPSPSATSLPLLLTGKGIKPELQPFPPAGTPLWYAKDSSVRSVLVGLVKPSPVLHARVPTDLAELMLARRPPLVTEFEPTQVVGLIQGQLKAAPITTHSPDTAQWVQLFWELFDHIPALRNIYALYDYPLIPTLRSGTFVSASACTNTSSILPFDPTEISPALLTVLHDFGFEVVDTHSGPHLYAFIGSKFPQRLTLTSILQGLVVLDKTSDKFLKMPGHEKLATWIRKAFSTQESLPIPLNHTLAALHIWPARKGNVSILASAKIGQYLPKDVRLDLDIKPPKFDSSLVIYDTDCTDGVRRLNGTQLSLTTLLPSLPAVEYIHDSELSNYANQVEKFCRFSDIRFHTSSISLPDGNGKMRPVSHFYNSTIPLFAHAFGINNKVKFIHPLIRDRLERIPELPLIRAVNAGTLLESLRALDNDVMHYNDGSLLQRAETVYSEFATHALSIPSLPNSLYSQIGSLKFIVRADKRTSSATYDVEPYVGPHSGRYLPQILSPSQVLQRSLQNIAWTQRAVMASEVLPTFPALSSALGVPSILDVVRHLSVLVQIGRNHPKNPSVLQDIKDTYEWLNKKFAGEDWYDVRDEVRQYFADRILLNVHDPEKPTEEWVWHSAREIIINLQVDRPHSQIYGSRTFLNNYNTLLVGAGCQHMVYVPYHASNVSEDGQLLPSFNRMRHVRQSTNVVLVPDKLGFITTDLPHLHCHSVVLEAVIPQFRLSSSSLIALESISAMDSVAKYSISTTCYGAAKLLEFVYTGIITIEKAHLANLDTLRIELLELLPLADQLNYEALKIEIGKIVVQELKMLDIVNYAEIKNQAELSHATDLLQACREFERRNEIALQRWEQQHPSPVVPIPKKAARKDQSKKSRIWVGKWAPSVTSFRPSLSLGIRPAPYHSDDYDWLV